MRNELTTYNRSNISSVAIPSVPFRYLLSVDVLCSVLDNTQTLNNNNKFHLIIVYMVVTRF